MRTDRAERAVYEWRVGWLAGAGGVLGLTGVAAGAFGAHALKATLAPDRLAVFETAVRYQMMHALALFACAWVLQSWPSRTAFAAGNCFIAGTALFSGSLYGLVLFEAPSLGAVTPVGGAGFLAGWILLVIAVVRSRKCSETLR